MRNLKNDFNDEIEEYYFESRGSKLPGLIPGKLLTRETDPGFFNSPSKPRGFIDEAMIEEHKKFVLKVKTRSEMKQDFGFIPESLWYLKITVVNKSCLSELNNFFFEYPEAAERKSSRKLKYWDSEGVWGISGYHVNTAWRKSGCGRKITYFTNILLAMIETIKLFGRLDSMSLSSLPSKRLSLKTLKAFLWVTIRSKYYLTTRLTLRLAKLSLPSRVMMISKINIENHRRRRYSVDERDRYYGGNRHTWRLVIGHNSVDWSHLAQPASKKINYMTIRYQTKWFGNKFGIPIWEIDDNVLERIGVINSKKEMEFILKFAEFKNEHYILGLRGVYEVFGKDFKGSERFLRTINPGERCTTWGKIFKDAKPSLKRVVKGLIMSDTRYVDIIENIQGVIDVLKRTPRSFEEASKIASAFKYRGVIDTETALVCAKNNLSEDKFFKVQKHALKRALNPTNIEGLPLNISIKEDGYTVRLLERGDPIGLFLGKITNCCQTVGDVGGSCAKAGFYDYDKGFLVVEKENRIITQSWVWIHEESRGLVLDSVESKGLSTKQLRRISSLILKWRDAVTKTYQINELLIGVSAYGITKSLMKFLNRDGKIKNLSPKDYDGYMDGESQLTIDAPTP